MSGHAVNAADQGRIPCARCGLLASVWCEHRRFSVGHRDGTSFAYTCEGCSPRRRAVEGPVGRWAHLYRGLTARGRRSVSELVRLASALESIPSAAADDAHERLWRVIRARSDEVDRWAIPLARRLFAEHYLPPPAPPPPEPAQEPDQRPGCYYVSAIDGASHYLVSGPYDSHAEALRLVAEVRAEEERRDGSGRAAWMAWGTARTTNPLQALLGPWRPAQAQPEASAPSAKPRAGRRGGAVRRDPDRSALDPLADAGDAWVSLRPGPR